MAVRSGRWDEGCDFVDQRKRREHQITRAVGTWLGVVIDQMFFIQRVQMRQCEGWAGAIAQQAFQPCPVCFLDTN